MAEELRLGLWRPRHDAELAQVEQLRAAAGAAEQDKGASKARALQEEKDAEMRARRAAEANGGGDGKGLARRIVTSVEEGRLRVGGLCWVCAGAWGGEGEEGRHASPSVRGLKELCRKCLLHRIYVQ